MILQKLVRKQRQKKMEKRAEKEAMYNAGAAAKSMLSLEERRASQLSL